VSTLAQRLHDLAEKTGINLRSLQAQFNALPALGTAASQPASAFLQPANNLSDVPSPATARNNLGVSATITPQQFYQATDPNFGPAMTRALADLKANAVNSDGYYKGSPRLMVPAGDYDCAGTPVLDITHTLIFEGEDPGNAGGKASRLRNTSIRVQRTNTTGATSTQTEVQGTTFGGDGTIIRGLALDGGWSAGNAESETHGIHTKASIEVDNCQITNYPGDGIYSFASAGAGAPTEGNANGARVRNSYIANCRNSIFLDGADTNIWTIQSVRSFYSRRWAFFDSSFLGNLFLGCSAEIAGIVAGTHTPAAVSYSGKWYTPVVGQEVGASTNAPSGTTADNAYWLYLSSGAPSTTFNVPAWVSGITVRSGGAFCTDNINAQTSIVGCYSEGGELASQLAQNTLVFGGSHGARVIGARLLAFQGRPATYTSMAVLGTVSNGAVRSQLGSGEVQADGILNHVNATQLPGGSPGMALGWHSVNLGILHWTMWRDYFGIDYCPIQFSTDAAGTNAPWGPNRANFPNGYALGGKKILSGTAAPGSGAYNVGDIVFNSAPAAAGKIGWVCTTAGSPGTWKAWGVIDA
jgi:hypothetical protein